MKPLNVPETFAEVLLLVLLADCVSWARDLKSLRLTIDDKAADRRSCVEVRLDRLTVVVRTLRGFDPRKNRWTEYVGGEVTAQIPTRRREKDLRGWITEQALKIRRCPNPESFSYYRLPVAA